MDSVQEELANLETLSISVIKEILYWKYPGLPSKMNSERYNQYQEAIRDMRIGELNTEEKVKTLKKLDGIGVPVASTILHFIESDNIPIVDMRAVKALLSLGKLPKKSLYHYRNTINGFLEYHNTILAIKNKYNLNLRKIDNALFNFHKYFLDKMLNRVGRFEFVRWLGLIRIQKLITSKGINKELNVISLMELTDKFINYFL